MVCKACNKEINGENAYQSKQAGMEGYYHWKCFVALCKRTNKVGAQRIEGTAISSGLFESTAPSNVAKEPVEDD